MILSLLFKPIKWLLRTLSCIPHTDTRTSVQASINAIDKYSYGTTPTETPGHTARKHFRNQHMDTHYTATPRNKGSHIIIQYTYLPMHEFPTSEISTW